MELRNIVKTGLLSLLVSCSCGKEEEFNDNVELEYTFEKRVMANGNTSIYCIPEGKCYTKDEALVLIQKNAANYIK